MSGMDKIPTQDEYKNALEGDTDLNKMIVKLGELNELHFIMSIVGKVAFRLVRNAKSEDFLEENCKVAWHRLVSKYAPHIALSLLKLNCEFQISMLKSIEKDKMRGS